MTARKQAGPRRSWGSVKKLGSGNWVAQYRHRGQSYAADDTFPCQCAGKGQCQRIGKCKDGCVGPGCRVTCVGYKPGRAESRNCKGWQEASKHLVWLQNEIAARRFDPAEHRAEREAVRERMKIPTVAEYAEEWLERKRLYGRRGKPLSPNTLDGYRYNLDHHVLPAWGRHRLDEVTDEQVQEWHDGLLRSPDRPSARAHAYGTLVGLYAAVVADRRYPEITRSPCQVEGGMTKHRAKPEPRDVTLDELAAMVEVTPERYRLMIVVAAYCGLRYGEIAELRRRDVDLRARVIRVERAVIKPRSGREVKTPKSNAGTRKVAPPDWLLDDLAEHMERFSLPGPDGLVFPTAVRGAPGKCCGGEPCRHLSYAGRDLWWVPAKSAAGRPELTFHDLRHVAGTWYARRGATIKELMVRLGHTTPTMAMRYQMAAAERDRELANGMPRLGGNVVPIDAKRKARTRKAG